MKSCRLPAEYTAKITKKGAPAIAKLYEDIADLESILTNFRHDHTKQELDGMEKDLARYQHITELWEEFGDIPMNPETECIEEPFTPRYQNSERVRATFPAGTFREDIWHWFEEEFQISIAVDLMY